jgi:PAS domain S-box-containing protein
MMNAAALEALTVLDTLPDAYVRLDKDFRFTFANRAALPLFGKMAAEIVGKTIWDVYPSSRGTDLDLGCRRSMAERIVVATQQSFEASQAWYSITVMPDSKGGICIKFSNIGQDQLMEHAYQRAEEKFSKAFRCSPAPMSIINVDKNYVYLDVNEAFERITGYRREEIMGRTAAELGFFLDLPIIDEARRRLQEEGRFRNLEARF